MANWLGWLGALAGVGSAAGGYFQGKAQDKNNKDNLAFQQQKQQAMMNLLGPMFQGQASPYQNQLNQMLGMPQAQGRPNPWQGLTGSVAGGKQSQQFAPDGRPLQAPKPGQTLPQPSAQWLQAQSDAGFGPQGNSMMSPEYAAQKAAYYAGAPAGTQTPGSNWQNIDPSMFAPGGSAYNPGSQEPANGFRQFLGTDGPGGLIGDPQQTFGMGGASQGATNSNGLGYTSGQYTAPTVGTSDAQSKGYDSQQIDISNLLGNSGSMRAQDGLMQMLNRDPAGQMVDAQGLIGANTDLFNRQTDRSAQMLSGRARGLGQLAGTANANAEALMRGDANAQLGQQNANLLYQTATGNADRSLNLYGQRIGGYGTLGNLGNAGGDIMLRGLMANQGAADQAGQFGANAFNNASQFNAGQQNNMSQFNANNQNQANQFNIGNQNSANQFGINAYMQALMNAQGMDQQQNQNNINLASIFGGLPIPQGQAGGNAWSNIGESSMMPWILAMANQRPATRNG